MNIGQRIASLRAARNRLEALLKRLDNKLNYLMSSCTHENNVEGVIVWLPGQEGEVRYPCIRCLDCGVVLKVSRTRKKGARPKLPVE